MAWKYTSRYDECNKFFANTTTATASGHFKSPEQPGQGRQQLSFTIDKDIDEGIVREIMHANPDECINDATVYDDDTSLNNEDKDRIDANIASSRFCTAAEQRAVIADRLVLAARSRELPFSLFERINDDSNDEQN